MTLFRPFVSVVLVAFALILPGAAAAGQRDVQLLQSYVGTWEGRGTFGVGDNAETIKCRLSVTSSEPTRVQFNGRCALAGGGVTIKGTLGYIEDKNRYEATMTSDAAFNGVAIGRRTGSGIDFSMQPTDDDDNTVYNVRAGLSLRDDTIVVKAKITDPESGASSQAEVPMDKKS